MPHAGCHSPGRGCRRCRRWGRRRSRSPPLYESLFLHPGPQGGRGKPPLCALDKRERVQYLGGRALPLLVLVRPGAAAGSALLKLLPLAPGSCRPRGAHTPALGSVPPAGFVAPAASIRGAGLGSGAEEPPPAPVFASLPGGAGPGPELSWALSRGVSTREGPGASPRGMGTGPAPAATALQGACKHGATAPVPRASPEGGCGARPSWGAASRLGVWGWVHAHGAGCMPRALPLGWGRLGCGCRLGPSPCPRVWLLPCPPCEAAGLLLPQAPSPAQLLRGSPCPCPWLSPAPSRGQICSLQPQPQPLPAALPQRTRPELRQAQVPLPPPRPRRAAGPGRRHRPGRQLLPRGHPGLGRCQGKARVQEGQGGRQAGCQQPLGALLYARVIYLCMLTIQEGLSRCFSFPRW